MNTTMIIIGLAMAAFAAFVINRIWKMKNLSGIAEHEKIVTLTDQNFQTTIKSGVCLVDFWAAWCMPCKVMAPILNEVAKEIGDKAQICKVNIEQFPAAANQYNVRSIPTLILFKNGKEINRFTGVKNKEFLIIQINNVK